ncbi:GGDEF domain-containing protein [Egicoccus halophilus]|uniref:GGDEF domain-containing protein n=1 Tax=Egicoccus halophilus TaxID=1670830 RepID=A0A8J3ERX0_9ACTN|nr:GGDEF domain-containing protein [Egicoccus halophilus]GGI05889.1 hypothetical protein GCM10011354_16360 [Egicoccus halophilus]
MARRTSLGLVLAGVLWATAQVVLPASVAGVVYLAGGVMALVALGSALRWRPLVRRGAWVTLTLAIATSVVADVVWETYARLGLDPFPSLADVFYLAAYPLYGLALWLLGRRGRVADRGVLTDALILGLAGMVLGWTYVLAPLATGSDVRLLERLVTLSYPVGDLVLLPLIARLVFAHGARIRAHLLVLLALLVLLVADVLFTVDVLADAYAGGLLDGLWVLSYLLIAAAAWHPSAAEEPPPLAPIDVVSRRRLGALAAASVLAPVLLLVHDPPRTSVGWVAGVASILLFLLVVRRMSILVSQVDEQARELDRLSRTDALTGAANRRALDEELEHALARYERDRRPLAFALLDLDRFKDFNDTYGHPSGDALLQDAVQRWTAELREVDLLARYGGEEFAVLLPGCDAEAAQIAVARLRAVVPGDQTCSAGIALARPGVALSRLVRQADDALYEAKRRGRDRAVLAGSGPGDRPATAPTADPAQGSGPTTR